MIKPLSSPLPSSKYKTVVNLGSVRRLSNLISLEIKGFFERAAPKSTDNC